MSKPHVRRLVVALVGAVVYVALSLAFASWTWPIAGIVAYAVVQLAAYVWRTSPRR
jgi:hypothetical protein